VTAGGAIVCHSFIIPASKEHSMSTLTAGLRDEIVQHLRAMSGRESMIIRDMERGLTVEQIAASEGTTLDNARNYVRGTEAMFRGELPTAPFNGAQGLQGLPVSAGVRLVA
jgi:hypothetical protein